MVKTNPKLESFFQNAAKWQKQLQKLRKIILACGLTEELKWNVPIYTDNNKNIVGINGLKEYCALAFFKGVLLKDPNKLLVQPGQHTQAGRWIKFTSISQISEMQEVIKAYIAEAIAIEKARLKVPLKKTSEYKMPEEFRKKLRQNPGLKKAFDALTPGRQRGYILYFSSAKQSQTREARINNYMTRMLKGKGLHDS